MHRLKHHATIARAVWIAECRERLEETVRMRLMSDVPLGMFLSGGLDSSAIAALMKRMVSGPLKTFSVGYARSNTANFAFARRVAEHHRRRSSRSPRRHGGFLQRSTEACVA